MDSELCDALKCKENAIIYGNLELVNGRYWFPYINTVYSYSITTKEVKKEFEIPTFQTGGFVYLKHVGDKIILSPFREPNIVVYDLLTQKLEYLNLEFKQPEAYCRHIVEYKKKLFILSGLFHDGIIVVEGLRQVRFVHIADWKENEKKCECTSEYVKIGKYLWVTAHYSNQILKFDMEEERYELIEIAGAFTGFTGITKDGNNCLWLAESNTGDFVQYDIKSGKIRSFSAPKNLNFDSSGKSYVHLHLYTFANKIVSVPALCETMTVLDVDSENIITVMIDFFRFQDENEHDYKHGYTAGSFGVKIDENTLWVQRTSDGKVACIKISDFTYTTFDFRLKDNDLYDMYHRVYQQSSGHVINEMNVGTLNLFLYYIKNIENFTTKESGVDTGTAIWRKI